MAPSTPGSSKFGAGEPSARMGCVCWAEAVRARIRSAKTLHMIVYLLPRTAPLALNPTASYNGQFQGHNFILRRMLVLRRRAQHGLRWPAKILRNGQLVSHE